MSKNIGFAKNRLLQLQLAIGRKTIELELLHKELLSLILTKKPKRKSK